jgi:hypothetical protein
MIIEIKELKMYHSNKRRVFKNDGRSLYTESSDWLQLILGEIKQYNDWVTKKNASLEVNDDPCTEFYHPPLRSEHDTNE